MTTIVVAAPATCRASSTPSPSAQFYKSTAINTHARGLAKAELAVVLQPHTASISQFLLCVSMCAPVPAALCAGCRGGGGPIGWKPLVDWGRLSGGGPIAVCTCRGGGGPMTGAGAAPPLLS